MLGKILNSGTVTGNFSQDLTSSTALENHSQNETKEWKKRKNLVQELQIKHKEMVVNRFRSAVFYVQVQLWQFRHQTVLQNSLVIFEPLFGI